MPGLTNTNATNATITNKCDGRDFDEISDAVDEGWCNAFTTELGLRRLTLHLY
jgi:hypothetical protein